MFSASYKYLYTRLGRGICMAVKYKAQNSNSRLTDFEDLKDYIVNNIVRNVPCVIKGASVDNSVLSDY
jgi:hypothetical protein